MSRKRSRMRGDTVVETIIAFAVFSAVVVGTILVMNRGVAMAQRSLEVSLVREQIDGQGEMLRYVRSNLPAVWTDLKNRVEPNPAPLTNDNNVCRQPTGQSYFLRGASGNNPVITSVTSAATFAKPQVHAFIDHSANKSYGVWVETTRAQGVTQVAYDFRIHACWYSLGSDVPVALGTIVRLYEE